MDSHIVLERQTEILLGWKATEQKQGRREGDLSLEEVSMLKLCFGITLPMKNTQNGKEEELRNGDTSQAGQSHKPKIR